MFPDSPFAVPTSSFNHPVPVPGDDPDASPTKSVSVACSWLPYVRGALQQLLLQTTWKTDDPAVILLAQQRAFNLISMFEECSADVLPFACGFNFAGSEDGWVQVDRGSTATPRFVSHNELAGWVQDVVTFSGSPGLWNSFVQAQKLFSPTNIRHVDILYNLSRGAFAAAQPGNTYIALYSSGAVVGLTSLEPSTDPSGSGKVLAWDGDVTADQIVFQVMTGFGTSSADLGSGEVLLADVRGVGTPIC